MNPSNYLWLTAGIAGITAAWHQVRSVFGRLISLVFVSSSLDSDATNILVAWLWANAKLSPFGSNFYTSQKTFIRPKNHHGVVAFRTVGRSMTFFIGWRPLFVSYGADQSAGGQIRLSVSYFRGLIDIEKILIKAADAWTQGIREILSSSDGRGRYKVRRVMGKQYKKGRYGVDNTAPTGQEAVRGPELDTRGMVPLGYSREDLVAPTQKSPFSALFYGPQVNEFLKQVRNWFRSEAWYLERNISWRFGGALYGPPGTGKTSLARAIAQELDIPINIVDLTTMDNNDLVEAWSDIVGYAPCLVLLEDLDRVFDANAEARAKAGDLPHQHVGPTLDCLLNCISGVEPSDGILVLATANDITKLDPALGVPDATGRSTRPGRFDVCVHLGALGDDARRAIALRILPTISQDHSLSYNPADYVDRLVDEGAGETGAQFTKRCADKALELYWRKAV